MKIYNATPESNERMSCPSTKEVIFSPCFDGINEDSEAFIAAWDAEYMDSPVIKDQDLLNAWNSFYANTIQPKRDEGEYIWDDFLGFLENYDQPDWIVYECDFYGMACGPTTHTNVFVVKADTILETDPEYDAEAEEKRYREMSEDDLTNEIISKQINAMMKSMERGKESPS